MDITITGRGLDITDRFSEFVTEKAERISRLTDRAQALEVFEQVAETDVPGGRDGVRQIARLDAIFGFGADDDVIARLDVFRQSVAHARPDRERDDGIALEVAQASEGTDVPDVPLGHFAFDPGRTELRDIVADDRAQGRDGARMIGARVARVHRSARRGECRARPAQGCRSARAERCRSIRHLGPPGRGAARPP